MGFILIRSSSFPSLSLILPLWNKHHPWYFLCLQEVIPAPDPLSSPLFSLSFPISKGIENPDVSYISEKKSKSCCLIFSPMTLSSRTSSFSFFSHSIFILPMAASPIETPILSHSHKSVFFLFFFWKGYGEEKGKKRVDMALMQWNHGISCLCILFFSVFFLYIFCLKRGVGSSDIGGRVGRKKEKRGSAE